MTKALVKADRIFHPPVEPKTKECWKCFMELRGDEEVHEKYCPRCACDLTDAPIDVGDAENDHARKSWVLAMDLAAMYRNWAEAHIRVMVERQEQDYSALDDFATTVMEHSFPYLRRLLDENLINTDSMRYLRSVLEDETLRILVEADKLFLEGSQDEKEVRLREYWLNRLATTNKAIQLYTARSAALCYKGGCGNRCTEES